MSNLAITKYELELLALQIQLRRSRDAGFDSENAYANVYHFIPDDLRKVRRQLTSFDNNATYEDKKETLELLEAVESEYQTLLTAWKPLYDFRKKHGKA